MAKYETILVQKNEGITTLSFSRPQRKNAMSPTLHVEMHDALTALQYDEETRVLIITGVGDAFCAGQDLKEYFYEIRDPNEATRIRKISNEWRGRLLRLFPKPTIASINGWCFGGAFSVVASCDLALAAEEATFGLSEINFGTFPGGLVTKEVSEILRPRDALYYIMTGDQFDGKRAAEIGFINSAVPREALEKQTLALANKLKSKNPIALKLAKEVFKLGKTMGFEEAWWWSAAKTSELSYLQKGEWLDKGIGQFIEGTYKPGSGDSYDRNQ